ncbi:hypothetical protein YC2023_112579 [Brassica napus]
MIEENESLKISESTVEQTREPTKFRVELMNKCPIINLRLKYQGFSQSLVDPTLLRVLSSSAETVLSMTACR